MKLISWNVNGIRAILQKGFLDFVAQAKPEILYLQETKAHPEQVEKILDDYPFQYWRSAHKKGYSGTAVFSKLEPIKIHNPDFLPEAENEGRVLTLEFQDFFLVNVYTPNSKDDLSRLGFRTAVWDKAFLDYLKVLEKAKPVAVCGDFNVAHKEIDLARPKENQKSAGFTPEERAAFNAYIEAGFVDSFRVFNQEPAQYTWWSYRAGARERNVGWRIDYFLVSADLRDKIKSAVIYPHIMGSDHCPVGLELTLFNIIEMEYLNEKAWKEAVN